MEREETTIIQYLRGCDCRSIFFSAGQCLLGLTEKEGSVMNYPSGYRPDIPNNYLIIRHYDKYSNELIELEIRDPSKNMLFYMMKPTGTFIKN